MKKLIYEVQGDCGEGEAYGGLNKCACRCACVEAGRASRHIVLLLELSCADMRNGETSRQFTVLTDCDAMVILTDGKDNSVLVMKVVLKIYDTEFAQTHLFNPIVFSPQTHLSGLAHASVSRFCSDLKLLCAKKLLSLSLIHI